uniref:WD repeat-containing protein 20 n=1 Tax=Plectus sambesii TaxID=2011161 RepID=A0A914WJG6_9BILA
MQPSYQPEPPAPKDDVLKSHFITREGTYKLMTLSEYSRPNRVPLNPQGGNNTSSAPVRVSFLSVPTSKLNDSVVLDGFGNSQENLTNGGGRDSPTQTDPYFCPDRICFNVGRELYVYVYRGVRSASDLSKPIDKRVYKGTYPTCHDFNQETATAESCSLIIGFSAGQIQLIDPFRKEYQVSRLYNEDRFIDKTRVTCLKWVPGQAQYFLASHASGHIYLYNEELPCSPGAPSYQSFKQGEGFTIYTCKTKSTRNPMYRWSIGEGAVTEFAFSGTDAKYLATVGHDGYLRIFNYHTMELLGFMRSYFGGLLCLAWSPDTKYIVTGGEDDLITVYSVQEKRIVCRGQGHKSWISQVAFDPFTTWLADGMPATSGVPIDLGSEEDLRPSSFNSSSGVFKSVAFRNNSSLLRSRSQKDSISSVSLGGCVTYRIGSVGHDTQLCLWDLTEDTLKQPSILGRHRNSTIIPVGGAPVPAPSSNCFVDAPKASGGKEEKPEKTKKLHKRGFSLGTKLGGNSTDRSGRSGTGSLPHDKDKGKDDPVSRLLGTPICPRMDDITVIEPLICKKIAHERLTVLEFREDCIVTACQEGFICTWARPGKAVLNHQQSINSPNPGSSPNLLPGGTVV